MAGRPPISTARRTPTLLRLLCAAVAAWACLASIPSQAVAQLTWEYSPYDIRVWIALDDLPELSPRVERDLAATIVTGTRGSAGYAWRITPSPAPPSLRYDLVHRTQETSVQQIAAAEPAALRADKLVIVAVRGTHQGYLVLVRELDVATQQWGDLHQFTAGQIDAVPPLALVGVARAVRPIARIERVEGRTVVARLRAGGLIVDPNSPAMVDAGSVLQPVVRRNARSGEPMPGGIYAPSWSYLAVESRADTAITCSLHSGYGSVIPVKGGPRTERLALGIKPYYSATRLELRARQPVSPGRPPASGRPLPGYEVFVKNPGDETTELVGLTDDQGGIDLQPAENPLRLFYIRNGGQLLARLPLVVGHYPTATANVLDDDPRLQAEAYVKAMQSRVMDLVARREILAVRIRNRLKKGDYAEARQLVEEFRSLPNRGQLTRELEDTQRRMGTATGITAQRIEKLFQDGQRLLQKFLDPATAEQLAREVAEAEKKGPPAKSQPSTKPPASQTT